jgi:hypothetical protein
MAAALSARLCTAVSGPTTPAVAAADGMGKVAAAAVASAGASGADGAAATASVHVTS